MLILGALRRFSVGVLQELITTRARQSGPHVWLPTVATALA